MATLNEVHHMNSASLKRPTDRLVGNVVKSVAMEGRALVLRFADETKLVVAAVYDLLPPETPETLFGVEAPMVVPKPMLHCQVDYEVHERRSAVLFPGGGK